MTIDAAHSLRLEHEVGSIEPGKLVNFTILAANPLTVATEEIGTIDVWGTVHEGRALPVKPRRCFQWGMATTPSTGMVSAPRETCRRSLFTPKRRRNAPCVDRSGRAVEFGGRVDRYYGFKRGHARAIACRQHHDARDGDSLHLRLLPPSLPWRGAG